MATISERLRVPDVIRKSDEDLRMFELSVLRLEAADTIDALVAVAERAWQIAGDQFRDQIDAALALARGEPTTSSAG